MKQTTQLMYQTALLESGFVLNDPQDFATRIYDSVKSGLQINPDAAVEEEDDADEAEANTDTKEASEEDSNNENVKDEL